MAIYFQGAGEILGSTAVVLHSGSALPNFKPEQVLSSAKWCRY